MKKIVLTAIICCSVFLATKAQDGGGCSKAIAISPGYHIVDTMIAGAATSANTDPYPTKARWYKYTPSADGLMHISSCDGGADTRLFIYTGTCDTISLFGFNDDYCAKNASGDETASDISKFVKAGKTYFIEWDNAWDTVSFGFSLTFSSNFAPTEMQACSSAKTIKTGTIKVDSMVGIASKGDAGHSNWYKFTPTNSGKLSISTCGVDTDTRLWVYKGTCNELVSIAESDDECDGENLPDVAVAITELAVEANTTYYLEWDDTWENNPFEFTMNLDGVSGTNDEILSKGITIAPNPARDFIDIHFKLEQSADIDVKIYNAMGQAILSQKMTSVLRGVEKLDVSQLGTGMYIVSMTDGTKQTNKKLVINR